MGDSGSIGSLIFVAALSFLIPIVLYKLKLNILPVVVAEIVVGLIIGRSGFGIVGDNEWLDLLSLLGFIYLMFLSGMEIDFSSFRAGRKRKGSMNVVLMAALIFTGIFLVSGAFSMGLVAMGMVKHAFLSTLIISTVSLGVVVPVLKERRMLTTELGQILLLVTVMADFATMILLAGYVNALAHNMTKMLLLVLFFAIMVAIYFLIKRFASGKLFQVLSESTMQFGTRAIFALLLAVVFLSESLGVENILGAFLAGVIVSLLKPQKAFVHQLESFGYGFLIPIFFVMVGVNLELRPLLTDVRILLLIPLLLVLMFLAKLVPMVLLKRRFSTREVLASSLLLSSKLSLVIAAATLAFDLKLIDERLHGAFILVAILSCLVFPVLFNRIAPKPEVRKQSISVIGLNHVSIPVATSLIREAVYDVKVFSASAGMKELAQLGDGGRLGSSVRPVERLDEEELDRYEAFAADIVVLATMQDDLNARLAEYARTSPEKRVIVRIEDPDKQAKLRDQGYEVFSTLFAARTVLRALIESPGALQLLSEEEPLGEITIRKSAYAGMLLRELPFPSPLLVLRIYRGSSFLVPHGNTEVQIGDRLLLSGKPESIEAFRQQVQ